jgi:hypothetical protein
VKDGFGGAWYPGNVVGSAGFYGSENEIIHMSKQVRLEVGEERHENAHKFSTENWTSWAPSRWLFLDPTLAAADLETRSHQSARRLWGWAAPAQVDVSDRRAAQQ